MIKCIGQLLTIEQGDDEQYVFVWLDVRCGLFHQTLNWDRVINSSSFENED